jgi:hypothetical protein
MMRELQAFKDELGKIAQAGESAQPSITSARLKRLAVLAGASGLGMATGAGLGAGAIALGGHFIRDVESARKFKEMVPYLKSIGIPALAGAGAIAGMALSHHLMDQYRQADQPTGSPS